MFASLNSLLIISKVQDTNGSQDDHSTGTNSPKPRPKTVTKHRTDGYQQCLVDIGAVESNTSKPAQNQTLSPKPKSEKCYICGKEFLLSSLKIHEKQCAKKREKTSKINNDKSSKVNSKTSSKISKKPQLEACYLCGKEFFVHSLGIHETQCIKNWKANKTPDAKDQSVSERSMSRGNQCNNIGEAETEVDVCMQTEQKSSKKGQSKTQNVSPKLELKTDFENNGDQQSSKKEATKSQNASPKLEKKTDSPKQRRLKTIPCYSCGVAFLPHSLKIHEKKCRGQSHDLNHSSMVEKDDASLNPGVENSTLEETEGLQNETDPQSVDESNDNPDPENNSFKTFISKKPKTIVCYICGQEFLKSSYAFHEKKCASTSESTKTEEPPLENSKVSNSRTSIKPRTIICYICGEEFLKSSYSFHEKKCSNKAVNSQEKGTVPEASKANQNQVKNSPKPQTIVCYICSQEFLKSSYAFHEKQCGRSRKVEEDSQNEKSPLKGNVTSKEKPSSDTQVERPQTPRRGPKTKTCYICGKEILLSSLKVHEQQCQKKTDILKSINQPKAQSKKTGRQSGPAKLKSETRPRTEMCYICGESFLSSSIKVHETQCEKRWSNEKP